MELTLQRDRYTSLSTTGTLEVDGKMECFTIERQKFEAGMEKPYAIPAGRYQILLLDSARFKMKTPHLQDVPGFTEIEIHPANYPSDLLGCIGPGSTREDNVPDPGNEHKEGGAVFSSRGAFMDLMEKLNVASEIYITILG